MKKPKKIENKRQRYSGQDFQSNADAYKDGFADGYNQACDDWEIYCEHMEKK